MSDWRKSAKRENQVGLIKLGESWAHAREGDEWKPDKYQLSATLRLEGETEELVTAAAEPVWDALMEVAAKLVEMYPDELADPDEEAVPPPPDDSPGGDGHQIDSSSATA